MHEEVTYPDLDWYMAIGRENDLPPRCPFASVERCPRYYQSLSLLGSAGSTKIDADEDDRLLKHWERSDLWPRTAEYATSIEGPKNRETSWHSKIYDNFCPEVAFDRFGLFASYLSNFSDELDQGHAHQRLSEIGAQRGDWRWRWAGVQPMHYTECPVYSPLIHGGPFPAQPEQVGPEVTFGPPGLRIRFRFSWWEIQQWFLALWQRLRCFGKR